MKLTRRHFNLAISSAGLLGLGGVFPSSAWARNQQVRTLVGYAPGGAADTVARIVGDGLSGAGYSTIVENRPGAAGRIALDTLHDAAPDGKTLVLMPMIADGALNARRVRSSMNFSETAP